MAALISTVISMVGMWFMFTKMGHEGWEGIIPIYNMYILFKELGYSGWMLLWLIVPIANIVMLWCLFVRLAKAFSSRRFSHSDFCCLVPCSYVYWDLTTQISIRNLYINNKK